MPIKHEVFPDLCLVLTDVYGIVTMADRSAGLKQLLIIIKTHGINHVVMDLSMMSTDNNPADVMIFADEIIRHRSILARARFTVIHSDAFVSPQITARLLARAGVRVEEFNFQTTCPLLAEIG